MGAVPVNRGEERRIILHCDDFGLALCANDGVEQALTTGIATSASVMMPCPWAYDAVRRATAHPEWAVGIHLTFSAEWPRYRWRPILSPERVPGLYGPDGFMWPRGGDVPAHASAQEVFAEALAQVELAQAWGLRPGHLDVHMGVMYQPEFRDVYLALAERLGLPLRMPDRREAWPPDGPGATATVGIRDEARRCGLRFPDYMAHYGRLPHEDMAGFLVRVLETLPVGTTERFFHPAVDTPELRGMTQGGADRVEDLRVLTENVEVRRVLAERDIRRVSYRDLA